jgi:hypothetical protein
VTARGFADRARAFVAEYYAAPWRAAMRREVARREDAFLALLFLEGVGVDSPASYYMLEVYPELAEQFHQWHRRMGVDRLDGSGVCC